MAEETKLIQDFERARKRGVPLLAIETIDPSATIRQLIGKYSDENPLVKWDVAMGFSPLNELGKQAVTQNTSLGKLMSADPPYEYMKNAINFNINTIIIVLNGHQFMGNGSPDHVAFSQAVWNMRDKFKAVGQQRTFVMLCPQAHLPEELRQDFVILEDPVPNEDELWKIADSLYAKTGVKSPDEDEKDRIIQIGKGLSAFSWEQSIALSLMKSGMNMDKLWNQKKKQVEQTVGLTIYEGDETFDDVRGADALIEFYQLFMKGRKPPTVFVFMDEIEKMFAGIQGDLSGTSQEQHGEFLRWMQDNKIPGIMQVGHPGTGKSHITKALAGTYKRPMLELNISALKGSLVGQTGEQTRAAFRQILAIGRPLLVATSNKLAILPPELKRRFRLGTWFSDLPTDLEKKLVWDLYIKKYQLDPKEPRPNDQGWTQSEIAVACEMAYILDTTIMKGSQFVVPVSKSDPESILALRRTAHKRFNSVSHPGVYEYKEFDWMAEEQKTREIDLGGLEFDPKKVGQA